MANATNYSGKKTGKQKSAAYLVVPKDKKK